MKGKLTRKVLAFMLTLAMVMTYMPALAFATGEGPNSDPVVTEEAVDKTATEATTPEQSEESTEPAIEKTVGEEPANDAGTEEAHEISITKSETTEYMTLAEFRDSVNNGEKSCYEGYTVTLLKDIDLNNESWTPIGVNGTVSSISFRGAFDGGNHTISNLNVNITEGQAGLFGSVGQADNDHINICNLTIHNAKVSGPQYVGAVVGTNQKYITMKNVHVTGKIEIQVNKVDKSDVGGIIGRTVSGGTFKNCSVEADSSSDSFVKTINTGAASAGGIVGYVGGYADTSFDNCFVKNVDITSFNRVGGIVGTIQAEGGSGIKKTISDCSVENIHVTVTGGGTASDALSGRHSAQAGLIIGCPAGKNNRNDQTYSNNTYSGNCSVTSTVGATDVIPTQLYSLWSLGYTRADDIGQTWGDFGDKGDCVITYASAEETGEVSFDGTYYKTFLSAYHANGAGKIGSSADKPFKLMTDVGYSLVLGDQIYVDNGADALADDLGHIFYPRTDVEGYKVKTTTISDTVTLYELVQMNYVAQIGTGQDAVKYETLAEAAAEAKDNDTVTILNDCDCSAETLTLNNTITVDLNGKTVTLGETSIAADKKVTIKDDAETKGGLVCNGAITVNGTLDVSALGYGTSGLIGGKPGSLAISATGKVALMSSWDSYSAAWLDANSGAFFNGTVDGAQIIKANGDTRFVRTNGKWQVSDAVAQIQRYVGPGTEKPYYETYDTLQKAFTDVKNGETIQILKNIELTESAQLTSKGSSESPITLDLNGYTISGTIGDGTYKYDATNSLIYIDGSFIEVTDTTEGASGKIENTSTGSGSHTAIRITGASGFELKKGTIKNDSTNGGYGIYYKTGTQYVKLSGGSIDAYNGIWGDTDVAADVNISGGKISSGRYCVYTQKGTFTMTGGTIAGTASYSPVAVSKATEVSITGGSVSTSGTNYGIHIKEADKVTFGGTASIVTGPTATDTNGALYLHECPNVTISGGYIEQKCAYDGDYGVAAVTALLSNVKMTGGEIKAANIGIEPCGGTLDMSGGTIVAENLAVNLYRADDWVDDEVVIIDSDCWAKISGAASITGKGNYAVWGAIEDYRAPITISGGTIQGSKYGIYGGDLTITGGNIITKTSYNWYLSNVNHSVSGGYFTNKVTSAELAPDKKCIPDETVEGCHFTIGDIYIAQIGTTKYETLQEAVNAANNGDTIVLLVDASGDGVDVGLKPEVKKLTFDFGGHTYTLQGEMVGSNGTKTNGMRFLKGSNITLKNGSLKNGSVSESGNTPAKVMINNYGNLVLEDFSVDGTTAAEAPSGNPYGTATLYVSNGPVHVKGTGTYTADPEGYAIYMANVDYYEDEALLNFDSDFTGTVNGKVKDGGKQAASVDIANGKYDFNSIVFSNTTMQISGGVFAQKPADEYIIAGKHVMANTDPATRATYPYMVGDAVASITKGEKTTYYATLQAGVKAAQNGDTVVLLKDVGDDTYLYSYEAFAQNQTLTIDLNGHKIEGYYSNGAIIVGSADVTITDSTKSGNSVIKNKYTTTPANAIFMQNANNTLNVDNVTITALANAIQFQSGAANGTVTVGENATVTSTARSGIYNGAAANTGSTININGGTVKSNALSYCGIWVSGAESTVTVNDGNVTGNIGILGNAENVNILVKGGIVTSNNANAAIQNQGAGSTVEVNGGEVTSTKYGIVNIANATVKVENGKVSGDVIGILPQANNSKVNISGGTVNSKGTAIQIYGSGNQVNITGGTVFGSGTGIYSGNDTVDARNKITVDGGSVTSGDYGIALFDYGQLDVKSGSVTATEGHAITNNGSETKDSIVNISGGTITAPNGEGFYHAGPGTLSITGGTISGNTGVEMRAGTINVSGGTLIATATEYECDANANGPTTHGAALAIAQHVTKIDITANITGGTFKGIVPVNECNPQQNDPAPQVNLTVSDGEFWSTATENAKVFDCVDCDKFISGGFFTHEPDAKYLASGKVVRDTTDEEKEDHGQQYLYTLGIAPVAPTVDENAKQESATQADVPGSVEQGFTDKVVDEVIDEISKNTSVSGEKATNIQTEAVESKLKTEIEKTSGVKLVDSTSQLKITVKSVATKTTETQISAITAQTVTTTKAKYDVKPWVTIETTDEHGTTTTETRVIKNEELAAAKVSIAFRLAVPESMKSNTVLVKHYPNDTGDGNPDWSKTYAVQGTGNNRYVALEANSFSVYELVDLAAQGYVAINETTGTTYATLQAALTDASGATESANTIKLLSSISENVSCTVNHKNVILDLNGYTLTGNITSTTEGTRQFTIRDTAAENKGKIIGDVTANGTGTLTLDENNSAEIDGTVTMNDSSTLECKSKVRDITTGENYTGIIKINNHANVTGTVTANSGTVKVLSNSSTSKAKVGKVVASVDATVTITGGQFVSDPSEFLTGTDYKAVYNAQEKVYDVIKKYVAQIVIPANGETSEQRLDKYETAEEALRVVNPSDGQHVEMIADSDESNTNFALFNQKLDLKGYDLKVSSMVVFNGGTIIDSAVGANKGMLNVEDDGDFIISDAEDNSNENYIPVWFNDSKKYQFVELKEVKTAKIDHLDATTYTGREHLAKIYFQPKMATYDWKIVKSAYDELSSGVSADTVYRIPFEYLFNNTTEKNMEFKFTDDTIKGYAETMSQGKNNGLYLEVYGSNKLTGVKGSLFMDGRNFKYHSASENAGQSF